MGRYYVEMFAPIIGGLLLAVIVWLVRSRRAAARRVGVGAAVDSRAAVVISGALPLVVMIGIRWGYYAQILVGARYPQAVLEWWRGVQFILPLILGALGLVILALTQIGPRGGGVANVARRTPWMFLPRTMALTLAILVALAVAFALATGVASEPGPQGLYRMYTVDAGTVGMSFSDFYGWYYSVPAMVALAVVLIFVIAHALMIARPPLASGREQAEDVAARRRRLRNALLIAAGAILFHLWSVFNELAGVASSSGMVSPTDTSVFFFAPSFAALEPALSVAALCAYGLGIASWAGVVLSAIPAHRQRKVSDKAQARHPAGSHTDPT